MTNERTSDVPPGCECPACGEKDADRLVWLEDYETVRCATCGETYKPDTEYEYDDDDAEDC